ncbi:MAG: helix-turn-helix domain-containing protein, partial [Dehalococcoidia bacterium]
MTCVRRQGLATRRRSLRMSQEALAQRLGVATGTLARWERGEMTPGPDIRRSYAELLDINVTTLSHWLDGDNGQHEHSLAPSWFSLFVASEQTAAALDAYEPHVINGLL